MGLTVCRCYLEMNTVVICELCNGNCFTVTSCFILGWGEFRFFRLGRESASLKLENLLVDHEKIHFFVMDSILALLLDSEDLYRISR